MRTVPILQSLTTTFKFQSSVRFLGYFVISSIEIEKVLVYKNDPHGIEYKTANCNFLWITFASMVPFGQFSE